MSRAHACLACYRHLFYALRETFGLLEVRLENISPNEVRAAKLCSIRESESCSIPPAWSIRHWSGCIGDLFLVTQRRSGSPQSFLHTYFASSIFSNLLSFLCMFIHVIIASSSSFSSPFLFHTGRGLLYALVLLEFLQPSFWKFP